MTTNMEQLTVNVGQKIIAALDRLGIGYRTEAGEWWGIRFSSLGYTANNSKLVLSQP